MADEAEGVALQVSLNWASLNASTFLVRFGTDATPDATENRGYVEAGKWETPTLLPSTTYYWQVIAYNEAGNTEGPVWSFTTAEE